MGRETVIDKEAGKDDLRKSQPWGRFANGFLAVGCLALLPALAAVADSYRLPEICRAGEFYPGSEFPGAAGSMALDDDVLRIRYDFSKGGHYVAVRHRLAEPRELRSVALDYSHGADVRLTVRVIDSTGQNFLRRAGIL